MQDFYMAERVNYNKKSFVDMYRETGILLRDKYSGSLQKGLWSDIKRLWALEPLGYVVGYTMFGGAKIDLSKRTMVPRPETEWWVAKAIEEISSDAKETIRCLDMFAGSGCIGLAVLNNIGGSHVDFADVDEQALEQIAINLEVNKMPSKRTQIIKSDIFENINGKYDYILANPPYVPEVVRAKVFTSALNYEPHIGLFGGRDGCETLFRFLKQSRQHLNSGGKIWIEFVDILDFQIERIKNFLNQLGYDNFDFNKGEPGKSMLYLKISI